MTELGIGLIGCGSWGKRLANMVTRLDGAGMVAVQDRAFSTAQELGDSLGVPAYPTYQELLNDTEVGAVLVVIPHSLHEEVCVAVAEAGRHIFCEKPLAINVQQCYRIIDAAEKHRLKLMCGQVTRLYPIYARVAEIVESGRLGDLAAANLSSLTHIDRVSWWARSETMGALLHSPGVHIIDYLLFVCGRATSVNAVESRVRVQKGVDYQDSVFLQVEFENGSIGGIQSTVSCLTPDQHGHIIGTLGSLRFDPGRRLIEIAAWDGKKERIDVELPRGQTRTDIGVRAELQNFVDWITHDAEPILTGWDGLRAVEIIDAAYLSIAEKRSIQLPLPRS
ncbi:Gfo/Idh/MocA family protein [Candidatus Poribacteria bacterium]